MIGKKSIALLCTAALILSIGVPALPTVSAAEYPEMDYSGSFADSPSVGQLRVTCGASGYVQEEYLAEAGNSEVRKVTIGGQHTAMSRAIQSGDAFRYEIPMEDMRTSPKYLSMSTYGKPSIKINGEEVYNGSKKQDTNGYTPREFSLNTEKIEQDGKLIVEVTNAGGEPDWAGVLWLEVGESSLWQTRAKHIVWDTEDVLWQTGYFDGTGNEFCGGISELTVGDGDFSTLNATGPVKIYWDQDQVEPGCDYYLLVGVVRGGDTVIDVGDDGEEELDRSGAGEKVYDLKVTDDIAAGSNVVRIDNGGTLDFVTLVKTREGVVSDDELRVVFKGNEMARDWSRLANNTMYWHNDFMVDESTGYIDASLMNGIFVNGYWVADAAPAAVEMSKWGYYADTMQATKFWENAADYCNVDNGASAIMMTVMVQMMKTENFQGQYTEDCYPSLKTGMEYYCTKMDESGIDMIRGNNWETTSGDYGMYNNSNAYFAMLNGVLAAEKTGHTEDAEKWKGYADRLKAAIDKMILEEDVEWMGNELPAGSFRYSISAPGVDSANGCAAGWFGVGSAEDLYYGYEGNAVPEWRDAVNVMLDYHPGAFWDDWALYGHNRGFGTSYGVLSERGGWPLSAMLMSDRMEMANKNLEHVVYNSVDLHFEDDNEGVQETSPWVLLREVSKNDRGIKGADIGNGGASEDMNLVEYTVALKNVRIMAGLDDSLAGDDNLKIMPRIPKVWNGVDVNSWPVLYKDGEDYKTTEVSYDYALAPEQASIHVTADNDISGVQFRFGPFDLSAEITGATVNGAPAAVTDQISGDAKWAYVTADVSASGTDIAVNAAIPSLVEYENFDDGTLDGWNTVAGEATNVGGRASLTAADGKGVLLSGTQQSEANGMVYSADVQMDAEGETGLLFGADAEGNGGWRLTLTSNESENVFGSIAMVDNTTGEDIFRQTLNVNPGRAYNLKVVSLDGGIAIFLNGVRIAYAYVDMTGGYYGFTTSSQGTFDIAGMDNSATEDMMVKLESLDSTIGKKKDLEVITNVPLQVKTKAMINGGGSLEVGNAQVKVDKEDGVTINGSSITFAKPGSYTVWTELKDKEGILRSNDITLNVVALENGTLLVDESFDSQLFPGTQYGGIWSLEDGKAQAVTEGDGWYLSNNQFSDFALSADLTLKDGNAVGLTFRNTDNPSGNGYDLIIDAVDGKMKLCRRPYEAGWEIGSYTFSVEKNKPYHVDVIAEGDHFKVYLDGFLAIDATDSRYTSGRIGLFGNKSTAQMDNVKIYSNAEVDENTELTISIPDEFLFNGLSTQASVMATLSSGDILDVTNRLEEFGITLEASDPGVLSIEGSRITAVGDGEATLSAKMTTSSGDVVSNEITVTTETLKEITMTLPSDQLLLGSSLTADVKAVLADGTSRDLQQGAELTLISSDEEILTPEANNVLGAKRGAATLKAQVKINGEVAAESEEALLYVYEQEDAAWVGAFEQDFSDTESALDGWTVISGNWTLNGDTLSAAGTGDMWILNTGAGVASDVIYEGDVTVSDISTGISIRMQQTDAGLLGYDIALDKTCGLQIAKRTPGWQKVAANPDYIGVDGDHHIKVVAEGPTITIQVDGEDALTYTDPNPYLSGYFGAFAYNGGSHDNLAAEKFAYKPVQSITVSPESGKYILQGEGDTVQLQAQIMPSDASNQQIEWVVKSGPATIDANGLLSATGYGKVTVLAKSLDVTGSSAEITLEIVDKRLLNQTIEYAEGRDLENVNEEVVKLFTQALEKAKQISADETAAQADIDKAAEELLKMVQYLAFESNSEELDALIELAENMDLENYPDNLVKEEFLDALQYAKDVLADTTSLDEQYQEAIDRLQAAISRMAINLDQLVNTIGQADSILQEYDRYLDIGKAEFEKAYENAKAQLNDPQSQEAVDQATSSLLAAMLELRRIPSKDALLELIESAKKIDKSQYTDETAAVLEQALAKAQKVADDPQADEDDVAAAQQELSAAINGLKPIVSEGPEASEKPEENGSESPIPTGDAAPIAAILLLGTAAAAGVVVLKKRK